MSATCDRLHCLLLGWEYSPEWISIEGGDDKVLRLPVIGILVHAPIGWVLLETGIGRATAADPATGGVVYPFGAPDFPGDGDPLLESLAAHGVTPDDLELAAASHLHIDHAGGLRHLAGVVPVAVQRRELEFATTRAGLDEAYVRGDYDLDALEWIVVDGDAELTPGIDLLSTPGHTPGHMSYRVHMGESGTWLFAVDAIDLQQGIDENRAIGWSADPADAGRRRESHDRLVAMAGAERARLVPGHCPVVWPPLAAGSEGFR